MNPSRRRFFQQISGAAFGAWSLPGLGLAEAAPALHVLPRSLPEDEGVASKGILDFIHAMEEAKHELHSFMMLRHGKVIAEGWWAPYAPDLRHTMYSMSKSFTSTAVGFAVAEKKLTVEDKVISFFPEDLPDKVSENHAALRVRDLLSMSVGNGKEPTQPVVKSENWVRTFLAQPITHKPGTVFMYNSAATYMCSAIVQKVTGQKILNYLTPRLFEPLGITGMTWETCPRGINTGGWGLSIRSEGLAKFGQLYLQEGLWQGRRILPESWVREATTFKIQQPLSSKPGRPSAKNDWQQGYGYQFWRAQHGAYRGDGAFGQFTVVLPDQEAVVVMTGESSNMQGELDLVWQHLLPAIQGRSLPPNPQAQTALARKLESLSLPAPKGQPAPALAASISGRTFKIEGDAAGVQSVSFNFKKPGCIFTASYPGGRDYRILHQMNGWQLGSTDMPGIMPRLISGGGASVPQKHLVAASAAWTDDTTLELTWRLFETPHSSFLTCKFEGEGAGTKVTLTFLNSIAKMRGSKDGGRPDLVGRLV